MRNVLLAATALSSLAAALPQKIAIEAALAVPKPAVLGPKLEEKPNTDHYNESESKQKVTELVAENGVQKNSKRSENDDCAPQSGGAGSKYNDGAVSDYLDSSNPYRLAANAATTPGGYNLAFKDLTAATEQIGYLTYKNIEDGTYNVAECAAFCDSEKFCLGFNIYVERDPTVKPAAACANPAPLTNVKCALFGYPVSANSATNGGQFREQFQVAITASNGYSKADTTTCKGAPAVSDFKAPTNLPAAINAPLAKKNGRDYDTYNGMRLFNENPYDPSLCAAACEAQTAFDKEHLVDANGDYKPCNFFTSYILTKNGVPLGTYCAFYTQTWDTSYAVNTGYDWEADQYRVICAASYESSTLDPGHVSV